MSLLMSLGIMLTTQNLGATSYSQTLTGDLETDSAEGHDYLSTETVPGDLTYNFSPSDKIHILGDYSVLIPDTTNFEEYYGVKIEAENSNNLNLTSLKNISIDISGATETTISEGQFIGSNLEAVGVRDDGKGDISFGDDTQININNTSGDWAVGRWSGADLRASFTGISQEGIDGTSSQIFGDRTQITLSDIAGEVSLEGGGNNIGLASTLIGIRQSASTGVDTSQIFGDDSQITLTSSRGDIKGEGFFGSRSQHTGIGQEGIDGTSSQVFGDRTQITLSDIVGEVSQDVEGSGTMHTSTLIGIHQSANIGGEANQIFGDDSRVTLTSSRGDINGSFHSDSRHTGIGQEGGDGTSSQSFGDRTQIVLNDIFGEMSSAEARGSINLTSSLIGIRQSSDVAGISTQIFGNDSQIRLTHSSGGGSGQTSVTSSSDQVGIEQNGYGTSSQSFGDRTQIDLNDFSGDINFSGEYNYAQLSSTLVGIRQSGGAAGTSTQIFGDDSQIRLTNAKGTIGGEGYFSFQSNHTGIEQDSNGKSEQSFGNRTKVFLEGTLGEINQSGEMSSLSRYSNLSGIRQNGGTAANNSQTFGDSTQIILTDRSGDASGVASSSSHSNYTGIGQDSNVLISSSFGYTSDSSNLQKFGDDTQVNLSITRGNQIQTREGSSSSSASLGTGISQTSQYSWYYTSGASGTNQLITNQAFGDRTQIILKETTKNKTLGMSSSVMENTIFTGVAQENNLRLRGDNTGTIDRNNSSSQSFGDDTQIILSSDHKDVVMVGEGSVSPYLMLTGISQNSYEGAGTYGDGSQRSKSSTNQLFGENTQIVLSNTNGDFVLGAGSYPSIHSFLLGVNQYVDLGSEYSGSVNHLDRSNSQIFGDNTEIRLNNNLGSMLFGGEGYGSLNLEFKGIAQTNILNNAFIGGTNELSINNSQIFGDKTRIIMDNHIGTQTGTEAVNFSSSLNFMGISQHSILKSASYGGSNDITIKNSQIFGNDTQVSMTNTKEGMVVGSDGSQNQDLDMTGIEQHSTSEVVGDPINYTVSQTFGDNTRVALKSTKADQ